MTFRICIALVVTVNVLLGIHPQTDRLTWALENGPVWIGLVLLLVSRRRFPLTDLACILLALHAVILMVGGYYSYAHVPLFDWIRDTFQLSRNHYDRVGHFAQGFVPCIIARELLLRTSTVGRGGWLAVCCVGLCLAGSALFELFEGWMMVTLGQQATDYLGTQGDAWDAQWDMTLALLGAMISYLSLAHLHDRSLRKLFTPHPDLPPQGGKESIS